MHMIRHRAPSSNPALPLQGKPVVSCARRLTSGIVVDGHSLKCQAVAATPHSRESLAYASYVAGLPPDARPLDRGKPRDEDTEGGNQPADKSLIPRRLALHSGPCTTMAGPTHGLLARRGVDRALHLDVEHKRLDAPITRSMAPHFSIAGASRFR
jgi:hypothetical protein